MSPGTASRTLVNLSSHVAGLGLYRLLVRIERQSFSFSYSLIFVLRVRMVVYSPQVIENYQLQSGEGLSVGFVVIWLIGDICNFSGAIIAGLLPTIILLGFYVSQSISWYTAENRLIRLGQCPVHRVRRHTSSPNLLLSVEAGAPRFSADGRSVAVPELGGGETLAVVDVATRTPRTTVPLGGSAADVAVSPDGHAAYAHADGGSDGAQGTLLTLDPSTWAVLGRTPVAAVNSAGVAVSPDGSRVDVVDQGSGVLDVVAVR